MKTIGLIGGTSWVSTVDYYTKINQLVNETLGSLHSAKVLLYSVNFHEFKQYIDNKQWDEAAIMFSEIGKKLEETGVDFIAIAANTPHVIADQLRSSVKIPLLHIAEATVKELTQKSIKKVALLGTKPTMEMPFFKNILEKSDIETWVPEENDRDFIHEIIFAELAHGVSKPETKKRIIKVIDSLKEKGAEAVIFGCTELSFLIKESESSLPVFDTTNIHINAIVRESLS